MISMSKILAINTDSKELLRLTEDVLLNMGLDEEISVIAYDTSKADYLIDLKAEVNDGDTFVFTSAVGPKDSFSFGKKPECDFYFGEVEDEGFLYFTVYFKGDYLYRFRLSVDRKFDDYLMAIVSFLIVICADFGRIETTLSALL
jgi:hypothetical protein